jgi:hypothetical protein
MVRGVRSGDRHRLRLAAGETMNKPKSELNQAAEHHAEQKLARVGAYEELDRYDLEAAFLAGADWEAKRAKAESGTAELLEALQKVCGHSNCYCGNCKAISQKYYVRKDGKK